MKNQSIGNPVMQYYFVLFIRQIYAYASLRHDTIISYEMFLAFALLDMITVDECIIEATNPDDASALTSNKEFII